MLYLLAMKRNFVPWVLLLFFGCQNPTPSKEPTKTKSNYRLPSSFKSYWFDGTAEISSYTLEQSRYGSVREGSAVMIFVTEDFLPNSQVKANKKSAVTKSVLKLNRTKRFLTGIYPYSIMSSSFSYLGIEPRLAKLSCSLQEWCGQSYLQLNTHGENRLISHSYFEGEADQNVVFPEPLLTEDALWNLIRIHPEELPVGSFAMLPSLEVLRLNHLPLQTVAVTAQYRVEETFSVYEVDFPSINRHLTITFETQAPHRIETWIDRNGQGPENTTTAQRKQTQKLPYWKLNKVGDETYRTFLDLNSTL